MGSDGLDKAFGVLVGHHADNASSHFATLSQISGNRESGIGIVPAIEQHRDAG